MFPQNCFGVSRERCLGFGSTSPAAARSPARAPQTAQAAPQSRREQPNQGEIIITATKRPEAARRRFGIGNGIRVKRSWKRSERRKPRRLHHPNSGNRLQCRRSGDSAAIIRGIST